MHEAYREGEGVSGEVVHLMRWADIDPNKELNQKCSSEAANEVSRGKTVQSRIKRQIARSRTRR